MGAEESEPEEEPLDLLAQLQQESVEEDELDAEGVSLEELSQSYANLVAPDATLAGSDGTVAAGQDSEEHISTPESEAADEAATQEILTSPRSIIESILFVGRPDNSGIAASELAKLMRGVKEEDVARYVRELNESYEQSERAIQITESPDGFRLELRPDLEYLRDRFYGPTREIALTQAAIDCLALVAYQPGISREKLEHQRSQPSGSVLNQLVRRSLLEIRRESEGKKTITRYYPTQKLVDLTGMASLEDLPQVEDLDTE